MRKLFLLVLLIPALAACDLKSIAMSPPPSNKTSSVAHTKTIAPTPTHTATPTPKPTAHKVVIPPSPFAAGAVTHVVRLGGGVSAVLKYYTTQNPADWRHDDLVNVTMSAQLSGLHSDVQAQVNSFAATLTCDDGSRQVAHKGGGYTINYPWSYTVAIPIQCSSGHTAKVSIELDTSAETYKGSGVFYMQPPALDDIELSFPGDVK